jgi:hypothetical protein
MLIPYHVEAPNQILLGDISQSFTKHLIIMETFLPTSIVDT